MENLVSRIEDELKGEVLLFCDRASYNAHEKRLIINAVSKRIAEDGEYIPLIHAFLPKLALLIETSAWPEDLETKAETILVAMSSWCNRSMYLRSEDASYAEYSINASIGVSSTDLYSETLKRRIINIQKMKASFDANNIAKDYGNDANFLITNNLIMSRYPNFYNPCYLEQLKNTITTRRGKTFNNLKEYRDYWRAAKVTLSNVDALYEKRKVKKHPKLKKV